MIPVLEEREDYPYKVLPNGIHECDEQEFRDFFLAEFPASQTREKIYAGFFLLRKESLNHKINGTQWVDGSFVESKLDPGDVDVVTFIEYNYLNELDDKSKEFVLEVLGGREQTKKRFYTHAFVATSFPTEHTYFQEFNKQQKFWRNWFGKTRRRINPKTHKIDYFIKGFIQMALGNPANAPLMLKERNES